MTVEALEMTAAHEALPKGKPVLITGSEGTIGSVLKKRLRPHYLLTLLDIVKSEEENFVQLDLAEKYEDFLRLLEGHDVVIHLAWNRMENYRNDLTFPKNRAMIKNVYEAALAVSPHPKVIMASSIHAAGVDWDNKPYSLIADRKLDKVYKVPLIDENCRKPDSLYGQIKNWVEDLGRRYSKQGLNVMCVRFGGVNPKDTPLINERGYHSIWLSHRDCAQLIKRCIKANNLPPFVIFYGISKNKYGVYDLSNAQKLLNYQPEDDAEKFFNSK